MSDDELFALMTGIGVAAVAWFRFFAWFKSVRHPHPSAFSRGLIGGLPALVVIALVALLKSWAAVDVRDDSGYMFMYVVLGVAWVGVSLSVIAYHGLSVRDDVLERNNPAAAVAITGACAAAVLAYAGGNFGNGPGWWVVVFSALLGCAAIVVLWRAFNVITWIVDRITIDRDVGAGAHAALLLASWGTIAMRAEAGNWVSAVQTVIDFAPGLLPMLGTFALGVAGELWLRPRRAHGLRSPIASIGLGLVELGIAIGWVVWAGWW